jgi:hypothetical protein
MIFVRGPTVLFRYTTKSSVSNMMGASGRPAMAEVWAAVEERVRKLESGDVEVRLQPKRITARYAHAAARYLPALRPGG